MPHTVHQRFGNTFTLQAICAEVYAHTMIGACRFLWVDLIQDVSKITKVPMQKVAGCPQVKVEKVAVTDDLEATQVR